MKWFKLFDIAESEKMDINSVQTLEVNNKRICLARLADGFFAIDDKCPHAYGNLGNGKCDNEGNVICPSHRYKFDLKTGKGKQGDFVNSYPIVIREEGLYIGFKKRWWEF